MHPFSSSGSSVVSTLSAATSLIQGPYKLYPCCIPRSMLSEFPSAATYLPIVTVPPFLLSLRVLGLRIITVGYRAVSPTSYSSSAPVFSVCIESSHNICPLPLDGPDRPLRKSADVLPLLFLQSQACVQPSVFSNQSLKDARSLQRIFLL